MMQIDKGYGKVSYEVSPGYNQPNISETVGYIDFDIMDETNETITNNLRTLDTFCKALNDFTTNSYLTGKVDYSVGFLEIED